jgi:sugar lactone lactonase YvrE
MSKTSDILLKGLEFPEGPRWREGKLWFSDMQAYRVMTVDLLGNAEVVLEMPGNPSGLGWLPDGRLLVVSMSDRRLLRLDPDGLTEVADLSALASYTCNDMVVDKKGRAYVGNFGFDHINEPMKPAEIILVTPDGDARIVADGLAFPNGTVITPDDQTLIVGETYGGRLTAFDIQPDGALTNRRVWADLDDGVFPDGICLDAEGAVWVASPVGSEVLRVLEGGEVTRRIAVSTQAYACMLGGPDRRTLFIATSGQVEGSGCIEIIEIDVPGAGLP